MRISTENIFQVVEFSAQPAMVFDVLTNSEKFARFTGLKADIDASEGGKFSTCNNRNRGFNLKLVKNKQLIQAWTHRDFPSNHYSILDIKLEQIKGGTRMVVNHTGVPHDCCGWLTEKWQKDFWVPFESFFLKEESLN